MYRRCSFFITLHLLFYTRYNFFTSFFTLFKKSNLDPRPLKMPPSLPRMLRFYPCGVLLILYSIYRRTLCLLILGHFLGQARVGQDQPWDRGWYFTSFLHFSYVMDTATGDTMPGDAMPGDTGTVRAITSYRGLYGPTRWYVGGGYDFFFKEKRLFSKSWWKKYFVQQTVKYKMFVHKTDRKWGYIGRGGSCSFAWEAKNVCFWLGAKIKVCVGKLPP